MKRINKSSESNFSWQSRLEYNFDNFMSKGGASVFTALVSAFFVAFVIMTLIRYIVELLTPNEYVKTFSIIPWEIFVQLIGLRDTGDDANLLAKLIGVVTIFIGLILFSSLVAFITQQFEARIQLLKKGESVVIEENHTLILGFSDRVIDIIQELVLANKSESDAVIVILSQIDKEEMDSFLRTNISDLQTTRVVTRNGSITSLNTLDKVGIKAAKSVIILNEAKGSDPDSIKNLSDSRTIKAILAVMAATGDDKLPKIVVELHSEQYRRLAENIIPGAVTTLNEADILARILVQTSLSIGLATVYLNLVGFEGNEFYFYRPNRGWNGLNFGELAFRFLDAVPIGIRHSDRSLTIRPATNYQLKEDDQAIILAEDDSKIKFAAQPIVKINNSAHFINKISLEREPERHLLIGWNNKAAIALREYASYLVKGSEVNLVVRNLSDEVHKKFQEVADNNPQIKMDVIQAEVDSIEALKILKPYDYNSIAILAAGGETAEEIDAKTLTILLSLRQIFRNYREINGKDVKAEIIAEIIDSQETDLVIKAGVKDFLLTNQFVSKILAQASQEPDIISIYSELFSAEGSEVYIKPIWLYFPKDKVGKVVFADCVLAAQNRDEICIGVKIGADSERKDKNFGIRLVPNLDELLNLTENDALITIAGDDS